MIVFSSKICVIVIFDNFHGLKLENRFLVEKTALEADISANDLKRTALEAEIFADDFNRKA